MQGEPFLSDVLALIHRSLRKKPGKLSERCLVGETIENAFFVYEADSLPSGKTVRLDVVTKKRDRAVCRFLGRELSLRIEGDCNPLVIRSSLPEPRAFP
ncbi:hypothetical protein TNCV_2972401 [Trichonephila clavipes]|nr:hypothetical protein TNCV_2972401 [Trichonephila clavipes]